MRRLPRAWVGRKSRGPVSSSRVGRTPVHNSFDDLIGASKDRLRYGEAECLGGLEIDDQLEFGRLLDWQVGRFGAFEDLSDVTAGLTIRRHQVRSVADQTAGSGEFALHVDRRNSMA